MKPMVRPVSALRCVSTRRAPRPEPGPGKQTVIVRCAMMP